MEATGTVLTNKYAGGYPRRRYYGGCDYVDVVEELAIQRVKNLFGAEHANVQPHSGAQANMAVYFASVEPGDTILGMNLSHGGHLTHGSPVNFSGKFYNSGGTDNHIVLLDLRNIGLTGKEAEIILDEVGITANKNSILHDTTSPLVTSGIRFGTPAMTTRGLGSKEIKEIAHLIVRVLKNPNCAAVKEQVIRNVHEITNQFPLYEQLRS